MTRGRQQIRLRDDPQYPEMEIGAKNENSYKRRIVSVDFYRKLGVDKRNRVFEITAS